MNKKTKILVIDDSASVRASLGGMLPSSADVIEASNGLEGLKQVQSHRPNLILLDCQMPEMDGIEVFRRLQRHPHFCRIPVVMMSACADEVLPLLEEQPYAFEFLSKPFKPAQLLKASHEAMKRAKGMKDVEGNTTKDSPAARLGTTSPSAKTASPAQCAAQKSASPSPGQSASATTAANPGTSNPGTSNPGASKPATAGQINETPLKSVIETLQRDMKVMQGRYRILEAELKQMRQFIQNAPGS